MIVSAEASLPLKNCEASPWIEDQGASQKPAEVVDDALSKSLPGRILVARAVPKGLEVSRVAAFKREGCLLGIGEGVLA